MSLGIYPVFNPPVPEAKLDGLGKVLAELFQLEGHVVSGTRLASCTSNIEWNAAAPDELVSLSSVGAVAVAA